MTIVGLLLIAIAVLLSLFSIRQFLIAKKMRQSEQNLQVYHCGVVMLIPYIVTLDYFRGQKFHLSARN